MKSRVSTHKYLAEEKSRRVKQNHGFSSDFASWNTSALCRPSSTVWFEWGALSGFPNTDVKKNNCHSNNLLFLLNFVAMHYFCQLWWQSGVGVCAVASVLEVCVFGISACVEFVCFLPVYVASLCVCQLPSTAQNDTCGANVELQIVRRCVNGCMSLFFSLCGPLVNWQLVQGVNLPSLHGSASRSSWP